MCEIYGGNLLTDSNWISFAGNRLNQEKKEESFQHPEMEGIC